MAGASRIPSAAHVGAMEALTYKSSASISNPATNQTLTSSLVKMLLDSTTLNNDKLGRWSAHDSGSGSADSFKWNGGINIDTFVTVSVAAKHTGSDGKPLYGRGLCYLSGSIVNGGHIYPSAPSSNNTAETTTCRFPLTFTPGDYLYYTVQYLTVGGTGTTLGRFEANLFHVIVEERH